MERYDSFKELEKEYPNGGPANGYVVMVGGQEMRWDASLHLWVVNEGNTHCDLPLHDIEGDVVMRNRLKVCGELYAYNITPSNKGLFFTAADLVKAFPKGRRGDWAYVGTEEPYSIYVWDKEWKDSHKEGMLEVNLNPYALVEDLNAVNAKVDANTEKIADNTELLEDVNGGLGTLRQMYGDSYLSVEGDPYSLELKYNKGGYPSTSVELPVHGGDSGTEACETAALISSEDFDGIIDLKEKAAKYITWGATSNLGNLNQTGLYYLSGTRTSMNDGLPILNLGEFVAWLRVANVGGNRFITQTLELGNKDGKDNKVYVRSYNGSKWTEWQVLQGMYEKGMVEDGNDINGYTDNGMYSGMITAIDGVMVGGLYIPRGSTILIVAVNGYAVGNYAQCTQMLYLLPMGYNPSNGSPQLMPAKMYVRTGTWGNTQVNWGNWDALATSEDIAQLNNEITSLQERAVYHEDTLTTHGKQIAALQNKGQNMEYDIEQQQGVLNSQGTRLTEVEHRADEHDTQIAQINTDMKQMDDNILRHGEEIEDLQDADKAMADELEKKAPKVGYAPDLKVNFAKELVGRGEATPQVIGKIRPTGEISIGDGNATIAKVKGNTVVWNQVYTDQHTYIYKGVTATTTNGVTSFDGVTESGLIQFHRFTENKQGHIYLFTLECDTALDGKYFTLPNRGPSVVISKGFASIIHKNSDASLTRGIGISGFEVGETINTTAIVRQHDLTQMFGAGNEPTTIEEFEARRPFGVTDDYNEGELISYDGANALQSIGFNAYNGDYAAVIGGQKYHALGNITSIGFAKEMGGETTAITLDSEGMFTPTEDGYVYAEGSDICIHLAHTYTPEHTTEYEEDTLQLPDPKSIKDKDGDQLFPYGLLSAGSAHDEITETKAIKRVGVVDMGTLNWIISNNGDFRGTLVEAKLPKNAYTLPNMLNAIYSPCASHTIAFEYNDAPDKSIAIYATQQIFVKDISYTDVTTFKQAMSGVLLYYELAEPIEVDLEEPLNLTYEAWDFGTEELHTEAKTTPLNADISYQFNAVDRIRENTTKASNLEARVAQLETILTQMAQANNEA